VHPLNRWSLEIRRPRVLAVDSQVDCAARVENDADAADEPFRSEGNGDDTTGRRAGQKLRRRCLEPIGLLSRLPLALIASPDPHTAMALCAPHLDVMLRADWRLLGRLLVFETHNAAAAFFTATWPTSPGA
jgi:hypothetical protein